MKIDIDFVKTVAKDYGIEINDSEAKKAHKIIKGRVSDSLNYYEALKEYFLN